MVGETRGTRVYVGNLCEKVKKEDLEGEFTKYGKLNSVWVAFNPPGFAFVEFCEKSDAEKACEVLNGSELNNISKSIRVEISRGRGRGRDGNNRRFGGGGQGGGGGGGFRNGGGGGFRNGGGGGGGRFRSRSPRNNRF